MNSPQQTLETILYSSEQGPSQSTTADQDSAAFITYLREAGQLPYANAVDHDVPGGSARADGDASAGLNGAAAEYRLPSSKRLQNNEHDHEHVHGHVHDQAHGAGLATSTHDPLPINAPAPNSPIDTSVAIPETLASLPPPPHALYLSPLSGLPAADSEPYPVTLTDRGEMGGKRRKALHDRAGWKDMEEDGQRPDKRARGEHDHASTGATGDPSEFSGVNFTIVHEPGVPSAGVAPPTDDAGIAAGVESVTDGVGVGAPIPDEVTGMDAVIAVATAAAAATGSETSPMDDDKPTRGRGKDKTKESRAEQNRKAQQIFRRRREEKIKQLESDSAALAMVRSRLAVAEARIEQMALDLEAKTIEAHALRTAVQTIATHAPVSVVTPQDNLTISQSEFEGRDKDAVGDGEGGRSLIALDSLCRASRELAKVNRARRLEGK